MTVVPCEPMTDDLGEVFGPTEPYPDRLAEGLVRATGHSGPFVRMTETAEVRCSVCGIENLELIRLATQSVAS